MGGKVAVTAARRGVTICDAVTFSVIECSPESLRTCCFHASSPEIGFLTSDESATFLGFHNVATTCTTFRLIGHIQMQEKIRHLLISF